MSKFTNEILIDIRTSNKFTRKELYNLSGFKERTILSYERSERIPSKEYIRFMSLYFNVSEDYINGVSEDKKPLSDLYRVFEMYKDIYPQNASKVNEVFEKHGISYDNCTLEALPMAFLEKKYEKILYSFLEIIKEFNIDFNSFSAFDVIRENGEDMRDYLYKIWSSEQIETFEKGLDEANEVKFSHYRNAKEYYEKTKDKNAILINKEFYASVIKKRNEPKKTYIPLNDNNINFSEKYHQIEQTLNEINLKMQEIRKLQDDLMMKMSE
jgi:transcriptional regulator with XRE-family HTH domain